MSGFIIGIFVTIVGLGLVHREHGKWYEFLAVLIIGVFLIIGFSVFL